MVTVVATKGLVAGDVLRRYGAEAGQDEPGGGSDDTRRKVVGGCCLGSCRCTYM